MSRISVKSFEFQTLASDAAGRARRGRFNTPHGVVETPVFMPVATRASIKGVTPDQLQACGASMILANTYHLLLRPGAEVIADLGGLHRFMGWSGPILTDSGGFQVFSLADLNAIDDDGVTFKSHIDGQVIRLDPEKAVDVQEKLGADVIMAFDECPGLPAPHDVVARAVERSIRWARRCKAAHRREDQALFGIIQGGLDLDLRLHCLEALVELELPGYAVGGLSVGEPPENTQALLQQFAWRMPSDKPRYLMGVGRPIDIIRGVDSGIDLFDCVMPTRNGRNSFAFTDAGTLRLRNQRYQRDERPLEEDCDCYACRGFSRAYLRHLFLVQEMLGPILVSIHNIAYYQRWMRRIRTAIETGGFAALLADAENRHRRLDVEDHVKEP